MSVRLVPFTVLSAAPPERRPEDVPVEETDMYVILQSIRAAAEATGWQRSAVPWPASLPERISLLSLGGRTPDAVTAVGVCDLPEQQRRGLCTFSERDQQLAILGGPSAHPIHGNTPTKFEQPLPSLFLYLQSGVRCAG